jgi:hypothetical protein
MSIRYMSRGEGTYKDLVFFTRLSLSVIVKVQHSELYRINVCLPKSMVCCIDRRDTVK